LPVCLIEIFLDFSLALFLPDLLSGRTAQPFRHTLYSSVYTAAPPAVENPFVSSRVRCPLAVPPLVTLTAERPRGPMPPSPRRLNLCSVPGIACRGVGASYSLPFHALLESN